MTDKKNGKNDRNNFLEVKGNNCGHYARNGIF